MAKKKTPSDGGVPVPGRIVMDREMAKLQKIMSQQEFASIDEANEFLEKLLAESNGQLPASPADTPAEKAQELIYQAHESNGRKRVKLAKKALEVYPDCADAYVMLAVEDARTDEEALSLYEKAVAAAERTLGPDYFTDPERVGHFWGMVETRPYMRARGGLAMLLWELGDQDSAMEHCADLIRLNPGDNQGLRYHLATWLVVTERDEEARRLLRAYPGDDMAVMAYMRALLAFRKHGAGSKARTALHEAFEVNPFVPVVALTNSKLPPEPDHYGFGDENEAIVTIYTMIEAWVATPDAVEWMFREFMDTATGRGND